MATTDGTPRLDLGKGVPISALREGAPLLGRVGDEDVLLVRNGEAILAVGAHCTHYHGPLAEGLIVGETVRCPLHHACFSLRTGEALRAPALDAIPCWRVERHGEMVVVTEKLSPAATSDASKADRRNHPASVVIIGGGAAGLAAADMLRREGYDGPVTIVGADDAPPCDRPNLSKEYLSGEAPEDWIPLRSPEYYTEQRIELLLKTRVTAIDTAARQIQFEDGSRRPFGALLIATGADPVRLPTPGADQPHVHYLRSFSDSRAIVAAAAAGTRAVVIGSSFIGLEVAAALRTRNIGVDVVAPDRVPLERVLGPDLGRLVRHLHEAHGVVFHLGETVARIDGRRVLLSGGGIVEADFVVVGVGVRPSTDLAAKAALAIDRGIAVNEYLETGVPGIFAAGDAARWLDRRSGERRRVEHWVVAERQGQVAAKNILGRHEPFDAVPFFWSQHYDVTIRYVGYVEAWDAIEIDGDVNAHDCAASFMRAGQMLALATISRDRMSLEAEVAMEAPPPV